MSLDQLVIVTFKNKRRYVYVETRSKRGVFKLYNPGYKCARSMHAGLLLSKTCTERAQGCMGQNKFVNMFLFLKYLFGIFKPILELLWEIFEKKYFFLPRFPLWFSVDLSRTFSQVAGGKFEDRNF